MKRFLFSAIAFPFFACNQSASNAEAMQKQIDRLQIKINNTYKPGLGEFMSEIQVHHAKLWFAGKDKNWALANFEVGEIQEGLDDIPKYCSERPEVKSIDMIRPAIYNIGKAIKEKDENKFVADFTVLTATCNDCHKATNHGFTLIKIPDVAPVSNQVFEPQ